MRLKIGIILTIVSIAVSVEGRSTGAPAHACYLPVPMHNSTADMTSLYPPQTSAYPITITVSASNYTAGSPNPIQILVVANPGITYKGILLAVRRQLGDNQVPVGSMNCSGDPNLQVLTINGTASCATHTSPIAKLFSSCNWTAPRFDEGNLDVIATIVLNYTTYYANFKQALPTSTGIASVGTGMTVAQLQSDVSQSTCGTSKGCAVFPQGCDISHSCTTVITYQAVAGSNMVQFEIRSFGLDYAALGISKDKVMANDAVVACVYDSTARVANVYTITIGPAVRQGYSSIDLNPSIINRKGGVIEEFTSKNKFIVCSFQYPVKFNSSGVAFDLSTATNYLVLASGKVLPGTTRIWMHTYRPFITTVTLAPFTDLNITYMESISTAVKVHSTLQVVGWMLITSIGVMIARHYRGSLDRLMCNFALWFHIHVAFVVVGFALGIAGLIVILVMNNQWKMAANVHGALGILTLCLATVNIAVGIGRPDPQHPRRRIFDFFHRIWGFLVRTASIVTFWLAFTMTNTSPSFANWGLITVAVWTGIEIIFFVAFALKRFVTYHEYKRELDERVAKGSEENKKKGAGVVHLKPQTFWIYFVCILAVTWAMIVGIWIN